MKSGTLIPSANAMKSKTNSASHGPSVKHVTNRANPAPAPKGPTSPIKGTSRGGV